MMMLAEPLRDIACDPMLLCGNNDGYLTPAGTVYKDKRSPISLTQPKYYAPDLPASDVSPARPPGLAEFTARSMLRAGPAVYTSNKTALKILIHPSIPLVWKLESARRVRLPLIWEIPYHAKPRERIP